MAVDTMEFANRVGNEMLRVLSQRSHEELGGESNPARLGALLGAALLPVGECLRVPIEMANNPQSMREQMLGLTMRMLQGLLDDLAKEKGKS